MGLFPCLISYILHKPHHMLHFHRTGEALWPHFDPLLTEFYFSLFGEISQTGHRCRTFTYMILRTWITLVNVFIWDIKVGIILGFPIILSKNELTGYLISLAGSCFFRNWRLFSFTGDNWKLDAFRLTGVLWIITSHCTQYFLDVYGVIKYTKLKWILKCLRYSLRKTS